MDININFPNNFHLNNDKMIHNPNNNIIENNEIYNSFGNMNNDYNNLNQNFISNNFPSNMTNPPNITNIPNLPVFPMNGFPNAPNNVNPILPINFSIPNIPLNNINNVNGIPSFIKKILFQQKIKISLPINVKSNTIYIKNLNEKLSENKLKSDLKNLFSSVGTIENIKCLKNYRAKGQAFISFLNEEEAENAIKKFNGFIFCGKVMLIDFAKNKIDRVSENLNDNQQSEFILLKNKRKNDKDEFYKNLKLKQISDIPSTVNIPENPINAFNPLSLLPSNDESKNEIKSSLIKAEINISNLKRSTQEIKEAIEDLGFKPTHKLFISGFSEGTTEKQILEIFKKEIGFKNLRYIPERDQCFIEFENEIYASEALLNNKDRLINEDEISIAFAKIL